MFSPSETSPGVLFLGSQRGKQKENKVHGTIESQHFFTIKHMNHLQLQPYFDTVKRNKAHE